MAKFTDILKEGAKSFGKYYTSTGRNLGEMAALITLASKVKRVKPEDYSSTSAYKSALKQSQEAYKRLQEEQVNPQANRVLNKLLGVTPEEQQMQVAGANLEGPLFTPRTAIKGALTEGSKVPLGAASLLGTVGQGALQAAMGAGGTAPIGKEVTSALVAAPIGAFAAGTGYGLSKLGQSILSRIPKPKAAKLAGKNATLEWGFKGKDIEKAGGWESARQVATELYEDAKALGYSTKNRYDKANALKGIVETLNADSDILVSAFDKSGTPAASVNQVINSIKTNPKISLALTKDPATAEWLYQTISSYADDAGNLSMAAIKEAMSTIQSTAGGFKGVMGDQGPYTKQILASGRSVLRDAISDVSPEISRVMGKLFDYINIEPSVLGQVVKKGKIPLPGTLSGINLGTVGAEAGDFLTSLLSGRGTTGGAPATTGFTQGLGSVLDMLGQGVGRTTGAIGGMLGAMPGQQVEELGEDDEGIQLIRSSFGQTGTQPGQAGGLRMAGLPEQVPVMGQTGGISAEQSQALKQVLAMSILSGEISGSEAEAVLSLLGMGQEKAPQTSAGQMDAQNAINMTNRLSENIASSGLTGPIKGLGTISPFATESKDLQAQIDLARQVIGKFLEGGVLRKEDEEKYKKILPTMYDTQDVAQRKLQNLMVELQSRMAQYESTGYSGYGQDPYSAIEELGL